VHCTHLPLDDLKKQLEDTETSLIKELEKDTLERLHPHLDDEGSIKERLDRFYYRDIIGTQLEEVIREVRVVGGLRKVEAMEKIASDTGTALSELTVVGDSITDYQMLDRVRIKGGIAVAFNGNMYAIPYANVGLATTDMRFLLVIIAGYMCGGTSCAIETVRKWEKNHDSFIKDPESIPEELIPEDVRRLLIEKTRDPGFYPPHFHYLEGSGKEKQEIVLEIHKKTRALVRGGAAKLG
jgi:predicted HAD superfamily phosphohydrolase